ncbi:MAG: hypothetical protein H6712_18255 [Myxococcales bacterium]|nr:hypothetical protein [Myxococcales bacterium]
MPRLAPIAVLLAVTAIVACPRPQDGGTDGPPADDGPSVPGGALDPGGPVGANEGGGDDGSPPAGGCLSDADCGDGRVCEGLGCTDDQPGTCAPSERMCTRDSQAYCGCDGQTFRASGSCPGRRYAAKAPCEGASPSPAPSKDDGQPCLRANECKGGVCEGKGCTDDQPGTCASKTRMCTQDVASYCGCDGQTFTGSGSCPGQRYAKRGEC